jgi:hypothetical protein
MNRRLLAIGAREVAPAALGIIAFGVTVLTELGVIELLLTVAALALPWFVDRPPQLGAAVPIRLILAAGVIVSVESVPGDETEWQLAIASALLLTALLVETLLARMAGPWSSVVRLRCPWPWSARMTQNGAVWLVNSALIAVFGLFAVAAWPIWPLLVLSLAAAGLNAAVLAAGFPHWRHRRRAELTALRAEVERYAPKFLLYFSAPPGSDYQVQMWLPYLERVGEPFVVVLAEQENLPVVARATSAPVVVCRTFDALDAVMADSVRAVFYVNNGMRNAHCVRYAHVTHVQLYHGDSDKAVTASPVNAMFDQIFVAGVAAIERFVAHGVNIPVEKFRVVGRPQVADIEVATAPIAQIDEKVVLYAPTWRGAFADVHHCSLPMAETMIRALLDRGVTVVVRPHPYTRQDRAMAAHLDRIEQLLAQDRARTGRHHRWGRETSEELSLHECMNLSHAMIGDVSTVASEYLYSDKPFAVTDMSTQVAGLIRTTALTGAAYVVGANAANIDEVLDDLLGADPLASTRHRMRKYYLGDFPAEGYQEAFFAEVRRCITDQPNVVDGDVAREAVREAVEEDALAVAEP